VASGGAVLTKRQVQKIRALNPIKGVILTPDNDKAGVDSICSNYPLIKPYFRVFYSLPPKIRYIEDGEEKVTKDWNEVGKVRGWDQVTSIFEEKVKPITPAELLRLTA
jgi:DNA primase